MFKDGRHQARRLYPGPLKCEWPDGCDAPAERHHKDGNTNNNARDNIEFLCKPHHVKRENRFWNEKNREARIQGLRGRAFSAEHRERLGLLHRGKPKSAAHRAALSAALKGRATGPKPPRTAEHRAKLSAALSGKTFGPQSEERRANISAALKDSWRRRKLAAKEGQSGKP